MSAVYIALPVALLLALVGVLAFIWSVRTGQLDDLTTPGVRVLLDDDEVTPGRATNGGDQAPPRTGDGGDLETPV
jgi:cbb3-type cytochrome oxidase maturation protein